MELDKDKIMQEVLARVRAKGSALLDFDPGPSRHFIEELVVDGASIFGDTKSWYLHNDKVMEKKKMTKAEAFEWLKCKKVSVSTRETSRKVQSKLFDCGVIWKHGGTDFCDYGNYYVINSHGLLTHCDGMGSYWECLINEEISADDILSIEIIEEARSVEDRLIDLAKPIMELLREQGMTDSVRITSRSVVLEPMALFLHGQILD